MPEKQSLIIILPEDLADLPIHIVRGTHTKELIFNVGREYIKQVLEHFVFLGVRNTPK